MGGIARASGTDSTTDIARTAGAVRMDRAAQAARVADTMKTHVTCMVQTTRTVRPAHGDSMIRTARTVLAAGTTVTTGMSETRDTVRAARTIGTIRTASSASFIIPAVFTASSTAFGGNRKCEASTSFSPAIPAKRQKCLPRSATSSDWTF
ncbi:hypothetical protein [Gordoniibacillus kamchatkensis]|uniref:hypothetical protein n=1 Tax=Gordoniibacillus kamchatkensis TaxID=1590651 RepID=UPI001E29D241|nr:hypothetical protein [Paenibacillus sp. VKM B-2647]